MDIVDHLRKEAETSDIVLRGILNEAVDEIEILRKTNSMLCGICGVDTGVNEDGSICVTYNKHVSR